MTYEEFIKRKVTSIPDQGFPISADDINPILKPHQVAMVRWMVSGGRRACFAAFGLGKTIIQLETVRIVCQKTGGKGLIITPLGVRQEFMRDAAMLGITPKFIRHETEIDDEHTIYLTNYETVRDGKLDTSYFIVVSLDEAAVLRGFGGSATFREFMAIFAGDRKTLNERIRGRETIYRFVATASPSPNEYIELLAYAAFLGIGDVSGLKTRFFKRNSTKADDLTIMPGKEQEFWLWVSGWGIFVESPADLGFDDAGYVLPGLDIHWHELQIQTQEFNFDRDGQGQLVRDVKLGVSAAAREKRISMEARVKKVIEIVESSDDEQIVIWCDQDAEQRAIERALKKCGITYSSLYGSEHIDKRDKLMQEWRAKQTRVFLSKSVMYGAGCNLQQSHTMIFAGINFKFYAFIQALHREYRFLQDHIVQLHLIYTDAEVNVRAALEKKWSQHKEMVKTMTEIIKEYGLSNSALMQKLQRAFGVERIEASGDRWKMIHNDCILETRNMQENSVGFILTSIPFSTQYEYSPNLMDFGHTDNNQHFFEQLEYLTPELLRVLQPGRLMAIHVKDRIVPGGLTGLGFQTAYPLHARCIEHYTTCPKCREKMLKDKSHTCTHRLGYMGMKTIVTDVVRENNQTYRLGWTEQCKDGSKMGVGMPEYLLIFRKPPTDSQDSYADNPVVKSKRKYTRAKWRWMLTALPGHQGTVCLTLKSFGIFLMSRYSNFSGTTR